MTRGTELTSTLIKQLMALLFFVYTVWLDWTNIERFRFETKWTSEQTQTRTFKFQKSAGKEDGEKETRKQKKKKKKKDERKIPNKRKALAAFDDCVGIAPPHPATHLFLPQITMTCDIAVAHFHRANRIPHRSYSFHSINVTNINNSVENEWMN